MTSRESLDMASTFTSALKVMNNRAEVPRLGTGSQRLDQLLGGIEPGRFYLFYGPRKQKVADTLLYRLMVEAAKQEDCNIVYVLCGNYRRDRTTLDSELLLSLIEEQELPVSSVLSRIHIICTFSENQLINTPKLVEEIIEKVGNIRLVAVQQISKLFYGEHAIRHQDPVEFTGTVSKLKGLCVTNKIILAASCEAKKGKGLVPEPMGGSFLRHSANVICFLRPMKGGDISAHLLKHFDRQRDGKRVRFSDEEGKVLGRITKESMRGRIQSMMTHLKKGYKEALKEDELQTAFQDLWKQWNLEQGAMIHAQVTSVLDLLNLTSALDNRREINQLKKRLAQLEQKE